MEVKLNKAPLLVGIFSNTLCVDGFHDEYTEE